MQARYYLHSRSVPEKRSNAVQCASTSRCICVRVKPPAESSLSQIFGRVQQTARQLHQSTNANLKMPASDASLLMNHTCVRIKDPKVSLPFYEKHFGMKLLSHFIMDGFTLYMLGYESATPKNWAARPGVLELCHNHRSANDASFKINNGNGEQFKGFGHTCITVDNIEVCEQQLLAEGVQFKKKLSNGRQHNIAFALDPDGYWIELVEHRKGYKEGATDPKNYRFNHTMVRVKDPKKSLNFYRNVLGMKLFSRKDFAEAKFSIYFLGFEHDPSFKEGEMNRLEQLGRQGVLELTYNWGTENDASFEGYHNGNSTENGANQGFGHICVSSDDPGTFCKSIDDNFGDAVEWSVKWNQGKMKNLAFIKDPDGYSIEIIHHEIFNGWVNGRPPK